MHIILNLLKYFIYSFLDFFFFCCYCWGVHCQVNCSFEGHLFFFLSIAVKIFSGWVSSIVFNISLTTMWAGINYCLVFSSCALYGFLNMWVDLLSQLGNILSHVLFKFHCCPFSFYSFSGISILFVQGFYTISLITVIFFSVIFMF